MTRIEAGSTVWLVRRVPAGRGVATREAAADLPFLGVLAVVSSIGALFAALLWTTPPPPTTRATETMDRMVELVLQAPTPPPPPAPAEAPPDPPRSAEKAPEAEGRAGRRDGDLSRARARRAERDRADRQAARDAGVLLALQDAGLEQMLGGGGLDEGLRDSIGSLRGPRGTQIGRGGWGNRGDGPGGGGTAEGVSIGTCADRDCGDTTLGTALGPRSVGQWNNAAEDPIIIGPIDRSLIEEVVRQHLLAIRYCYQRQLQRTPDLSGKVMVRFVIAKDGSVSSAGVKRSSLGHPGVEQCIVDRFHRMQFPEIRGDGIVVVSYPFLFAPG